jgi:hypothetical protein
MFMSSHPILTDLRFFVPGICVLMYLYCITQKLFYYQLFYHTLGFVWSPFISVIVITRLWTRWPWFISVTGMEFLYMPSCLYWLCGLPSPLCSEYQTVFPQMCNS